MQRDRYIKQKRFQFAIPNKFDILYKNEIHHIFYHFKISKICEQCAHDIWSEWCYGGFSGPRAGEISISDEIPGDEKVCFFCIRLSKNEYDFESFF